MPTALVNGINLYYELHGPQDAEVLVLSNGIMMSTASWGFQTAELAKHMRVLLYDCRGMWKSDHPQGPYSMEQHADDLKGLLDALGIQQAHIGGISYGSEISMLFAIRYPQYTRSLIVMDGVSEIHPLLKGQTYPWLIAAEKNDPELLLRTSYHLNFAEEWIRANQAFIDNSVARYAEIDMHALAELMKAFYNLDFTGRLSQIKAPTLLIVGESDLIKGRDYADIISSQIPQAEYAVIPQAGHAICLEKPAMVNTLLIGFVKKNMSVPE
jgi:3-oxoadipate enol-lactonase